MLIYREPVLRVRHSLLNHAQLDYDGNGLPNNERQIQQKDHLLVVVFHISRLHC